MQGEVMQSGRRETPLIELLNYFCINGAPLNLLSLPPTIMSSAFLPLNPPQCLQLLGVFVLCNL